MSSCKVLELLPSPKSLFYAQYLPSVIVDITCFTASDLRVRDPAQKPRASHASVQRGGATTTDSKIREWDVGVVQQLCSCNLGYENQRSGQLRERLGHDHESSEFQQVVEKL
jgi:hypothetical protein